MSLSERGESPSDTAFSVLPAIICLDNQRFQSVHILASAVPSYLFSRSGPTEPAPSTPNSPRGGNMKSRTLTLISAITLLWCPFVGFGE